MIRLLLGAAIFAMCTATPAVAACDPPAIGTTTNLEEALAASPVSFDDIKEAAAVASMVSQFRERVPFADEPDRIILVLGPQQGRVFLIFGPEVCNALTGPADDMRGVLKRARGEPT